MDAERIVRRTSTGLLLLVGGLAVALALPLPNPPDLLLALLGVSALMVATLGAYLILTRNTAREEAPWLLGLSRHIRFPLNRDWLRRFIGCSVAASILVGLPALAFPTLFGAVGSLIYYGSGVGVLAALLAGAGLIAQPPPRE